MWCSSEESAEKSTLYFPKCKSKVHEPYHFVWFIHRTTNNHMTYLYKLGYSSPDKTEELEQIITHTWHPGSFPSVSVQWHNEVGAEVQHRIHLSKFRIGAEEYPSAWPSHCPWRNKTMGCTYKMEMQLKFIRITWRLPCWWNIHGEWLNCWRGQQIIQKLGAAALESCPAILSS